MLLSRCGNGLGVRLPQTLVRDLGPKPGDALEGVAATPTCLVVARDDRRGRAVDRMRSRALAVPEGYVFDRSEANAR